MEFPAQKLELLLADLLFELKIQLRGYTDGKNELTEKAGVELRTGTASLKDLLSDLSTAAYCEMTAKTLERLYALLEIELNAGETALRNGRWAGKVMSTIRSYRDAATLLFVHGAKTYENRSHEAVSRICNELVLWVKSNDEWIKKILQN